MVGSYMGFRRRLERGGAYGDVLRKGPPARQTRAAYCQRTYGATEGAFLTHPRDRALRTFKGCYADFAVIQHQPPFETYQGSRARDHLYQFLTLP